MNLAHHDPGLWDAIDAALSRTKQASIAAELNWPESKVSQCKTTLKQEGVIFLRTLGLKIVPQELECFDPKKLEALIAALQIATPSLTVENLRAEG